MAVDVACAYLGALDRETFLTTVAPSLNPLKLAGGTIRYDRVDIDSWVDSGTKQPRGQSHPTTADLIVEVSDSSLFFDTTTKAELYAAAGVPDYWIIDVNARTLLVLRDPPAVGGNGHAYRSSRMLSQADAVTPVAAPASPIRVADLLP